MNFLITGANGFLGSQFIPYLQLLKANVFTLGRSSYPGLEKQFFSIYQLNQVSFKEFLFNSKIDFFLHLAGNSNLSNLEENNFINCDLGMQILMHIRELNDNNKIRCVFFGSAAEYGNVNKKFNKIREFEETNPINNYGKAKLKQTQKAINWDNVQQKIMIIRPFSILGENMKNTSAFGSFINQIVDKKLNHLKTGNLNVYRDYIDVKDLVSISWKLMQNKEAYGKIINVCSGEPTHLKEMVDYMLNYLNKPISIQQFSNKDLDNASNIIYGDNSLLLSLIGKYEFIHWKITLERILGKP